MQWVNFSIQEKGDSTTLTRRTPKVRQLTPQAKVEGIIF